MISLKKLLIESAGEITVYRGVNPQFGDVEHGRSSIGIKHKLVGALGANYTDKKEIAQRYGKQVIEKRISSNKILDLQNYDDVIRLYQTHEKMLPPNLAKNIKNSTGEEQLEFIKQSAKSLREILKKKYDAIKVPIGAGDAKYLATKGLEGSLYIVLI